MATTGEKKITGRKRHLMVDTCGHLLHARVHAADSSEMEGAKLLLTAMGNCSASIQKLWCDGGYGNPDGALVSWMEKHDNIAVEIVQKLVDQVGFVVLPRRWVVERTIAWINRCRRLSKEYEHHPFTSESHIYIASIGLLLGALVKT